LHAPGGSRLEADAPVHQTPQAARPPTPRMRTS